MSKLENTKENSNNGIQRKNFKVNAFKCHLFLSPHKQDAIKIKELKESENS